MFRYEFLNLRPLPSRGSGGRMTYAATDNQELFKNVATWAVADNRWVLPEKLDQPVAIDSERRLKYQPQVPKPVDGTPCPRVEPKPWTPFDKSIDQLLRRRGICHRPT